MVKVRSRLEFWSKLIMVLLGVILLLNLCTLIMTNFVDKTAKENLSLPQIPLTSNMKFCSLNEDIFDTDYKSGSIILIEKKSSYMVGDKVLIKDKYVDKREYAANHYYLVGIISKANSSGMTANLSSYNNEIIEVNQTAIEGYILKDIQYIGSIYNNMIGLKGYILFGIIPTLTLLLIFFIMRLFVTSQTKNAETTEKSKSNSNTNIQELIDQDENIKLIQERLRCKKTKRTMVIIDKDEKNPNVDNATKKRIEKIDENKSNDIMKNIQENNKLFGMNLVDKRTYAKEEPIINEDTEKEKIINEDDTVETHLKEDGTLSADEIIKLYRQSTIENASSDKDNILNNVARMYYDNDIENYDK